MEVAAYPVPPGFFTEGTQPEKLKDFFEKSGLEFPPGSDIALDQAKGMLYARNTASNLGLLDCLLEGFSCVFFHLISVDLQIFEVEWPATNGPTQSRLSTAEFLSLAKENKVLLDHITAVSQTGLLTRFDSTRTNPKAAAPTSAGSTKPRENDRLPAFSLSEFGTKAFAESTLGPDGQTIDTKLEVRLRLPRGRSTADFEFSASFTTNDGSPVVVYSAPLGKQGKWLAVVARYSLIDFGGSNVPVSPSPSTPRQD